MEGKFSLRLPHRPSQKFKHARRHFLRSQRVGIHHEVGMFERVGETTLLFGEIGFVPIESAARGADGEGGLQEDEHIGIGDALPHILNVGVFLRDVTAFEPAAFERGDERGFA